jgi:hypothetical protein
VGLGFGAVRSPDTPPIALYRSSPGATSGITGVVTNTFALASPSSTAPCTARAGSPVELATSGERIFHLQQLLAER